jgi:hypothetical protein
VSEDLAALEEELATGSLWTDVDVHDKEEGKGEGEETSTGATEGASGGQRGILTVEGLQLTGYTSKVRRGRREKKTRRNGRREAWPWRLMLPLTWWSLRISVGFSSSFALSVPAFIDGPEITVPPSLSHLPPPHAQDTFWGGSKVFIRLALGTSVVRTVPERTPCQDPAFLDQFTFNVSEGGRAATAVGKIGPNGVYSARRREDARNDCPSFS